MNIFIKLGTMIFELHRRHLCNHSPGKFDAGEYVFFKSFNYVPTWTKLTGLIILAPFFPLQVRYLRNIL